MSGERGRAPESELECLRDEVARLRKVLRDENGDPIGELLDNQAWVMLSHVASRLNFGDPDLMEKWQDAWADGRVQEGYFTPNRGAAAWIAARVNEYIESALRSAREEERERIHEIASNYHPRGSDASVKDAAVTALGKIMKLTAPSERAGDRDR